MMQLLNGCLYLHHNRIIHRDLKLGNVFLSDDMMVKIGKLIPGPYGLLLIKRQVQRFDHTRLFFFPQGDFGLATKIQYDGERKKTLCGTPNYIAPEVLCKKGHSFEVDVWSLGCIL